MIVPMPCGSAMLAFVAFDRSTVSDSSGSSKVVAAYLDRDLLGDVARVERQPLWR
jgi:hypothetical protein